MKLRTSAAGRANGIALISLHGQYFVLVTLSSLELYDAAAYDHLYQQPASLCSPVCQYSTVHIKSWVPDLSWTHLTQHTHVNTLRVPHIVSLAANEPMTRP